MCVPHCTQATSDTQFADYTVKTAFLFPGQGAQTVGMAKVRRMHPYTLRTTDGNLELTSLFCGII